MSDIPEVVAVDMGGTLLRVGVVTADRTIAQHWVHPPSQQLRGWGSIGIG